MDDTQTVPTSDAPAEPVEETPVSDVPTTPEPAPAPETGDTGGVPAEGGTEPAADEDQGSDSGPSPV